MDLGPFYETTATLSPLLLAGTAAAYSLRRPPRTPVGSAAFAVFVLLPPLLVIWFSLMVLAGVHAADVMRVPVLVLLGLQLLSGVTGTAGFVRVDKEDAALVRQARREHRERLREQRRQRRRPHRQPHKPDRTPPDEAAQTTAPDGPPRTEPDQTEPGATPARHS